MDFCGRGHQTISKDKDASFAAAFPSPSSLRLAITHFVPLSFHRTPPPVVMGAHAQYKHGAPPGAGLVPPPTIAVCRVVVSCRFTGHSTCSRAGATAVRFGLPFAARAEPCRPEPSRVGAGAGPVGPRSRRTQRPARRTTPTSACLNRWRDAVRSPPYCASRRGALPIRSMWSCWGTVALNS